MVCTVTSRKACSLLVSRGETRSGSARLWRLRADTRERVRPPVPARFGVARPSPTADESGFDSFASTGFEGLCEGGEWCCFDGSHLPFRVLSKGPNMYVDLAPAKSWKIHTFYPEFSGIAKTPISIYSNFDAEKMVNERRCVGAGIKSSPAHLLAKFPKTFSIHFPLSLIH
ncbi:Hypothetical protein CINCED_3A017302 [Cinara cedri]|uniref:Uncharacterized protein n=1 Tax=Cinara cedri TaxID=506608 RepID=A0A5E4MF68_9HEMI|nr:Hypothetical protein CINCED_3A017302 [Cinara cedri]